jgi:hypothetical protein
MFASWEKVCVTHDRQVLVVHKHSRVVHSSHSSNVQEATTQRMNDPGQSLIDEVKLSQTRIAGGSW